MLSLVQNIWMSAGKDPMFYLDVSYIPTYLMLSSSCNINLNLLGVCLNNTNKQFLYPTALCIAFVKLRAGLA